MSQNIDTIYNYLVVSDTLNNTTTTLSNTSVNFGSNLLTTPINTIINNSGINTPFGNIGFGEVLIIRDATKALALPIPNDGLTLKVVDVIQIANQENPIGDTHTNYGYNSITANTGLTINGTVNFTSCPSSSIIASAPNDLINLNYLQNNPPASAVVFYLNNSLVPSPPISTYKLLDNIEDNLPQSNIPTTITGTGTIQLIQTFSNQISNLNTGVFIPSGIWDLNIFAKAVSASDTTHINLYFSIFGRTIGGVETQIGTDSSLVSIDAIIIQQLKMTVVLQYTDISAYDALVIKIFGVNNRIAQTDIITYYEGTSTYSHLHTTFGVYVPPSLLSLNNIWTGLNSFTKYITVPDITINNNITTNITQTSTTITVNLGNFQYKNFSLTMNQNITSFAISNGVSNGEYKIYLTGGGFTFNKLIGYPNDLYGDTLMGINSNWILKIYCIAIGTYKISIINFT